jgi:hypothetical protein
MTIKQAVYVLRLFLLIALLIAVDNVSAKTDACTPFDSWVGGARFDYEVDKYGNSNLPSDAALSDKVLFPKSGLWRYYSISEDAAYVLVYLDYDGDLSADTRAGRTHVCAYRIAGSGMGTQKSEKHPMSNWIPYGMWS